MAVSSMQVFWTSALLIRLQRVFYTRKQLAPYSKLEAYFFVACLIGWVVRNSIVYPDRYYALRARWIDESPLRHTLGGIGVVAALISGWLALILLGIGLG